MHFRFSVQSPGSFDHGSVGYQATPSPMHHGSMTPGASMAPATPEPGSEYNALDWATVDIQVKVSAAHRDLANRKAVIKGVSVSCQVMLSFVLMRWRFIGLNFRATCAHCTCWRRIRRSMSVLNILSLWFPVRGTMLVSWAVMAMLVVMMMMMMMIMMWWWWCHCKTNSISFEVHMPRSLTVYVQLWLVQYLHCKNVHQHGVLIGQSFADVDRLKTGEDHTRQWEGVHGALDEHRLRRGDHHNGPGQVSHDPAVRPLQDGVNGAPRPHHEMANWVFWFLLKVTSLFVGARL